MSAVQETRLAETGTPELSLAALSDRRADIDAKQTLVADLLKDNALLFDHMHQPPAPRKRD